MAWFAYAPGLAGDFLFDDYANLDKLGDFGEVDSPRAALHYFLASQAGPGGRPIAVASFLLDDVSWPSDPYLFKYHNLLFHLLAACFLFGLFHQIALALRHPHPAWLALLGAGLWLLHPFFVSTVLFVVQRMAILSALFTLLGLWMYAAGRRRLAEGKGFWLMVLGIAMTPLAFLSKENGALLPLLALVLEATVFAGVPVDPAKRRLFALFKGVFLYLPVLAILAYFALDVERRVLGGYALRPFTLEERLLTEARILFDYLKHLFLPAIQTAGLYHDNYPLSKGLLTPWTTLPAVMGILVLGASAWILRRRWPLLSLAVFFFLAGHLLESSVIPLELYFEHRNYLPAAMIFLAMAWGILKLRPPLAVPVSVTLAALLAVLTWARAGLWGDVEKLALVWAHENPGSMRAQQQAAIIWEHRGQYAMAIHHIDEAIRHHPREPVLHLQRIALKCAYPRIPNKEVEETARLLATEALSSYTVTNLENIGEHVLKGRCTLTEGELLELIEAMLSHPYIGMAPGMRQSLLYLKGRVLASQERGEEAEKTLIEAFHISPTPQAGMQIVGMLATLGRYQAALDLLGEVEARVRAIEREGGWKAKLMLEAYDFEHEIPRIRRQVLEDMGLGGDHLKRSS